MCTSQVAVDILSCYNKARVTDATQNFVDPIQQLHNVTQVMQFTSLESILITLKYKKTWEPYYHMWNESIMYEKCK